MKSNDIIELISKSLTINDKILNPYQVELREIITEFDEYIENYLRNTNFKLLEKSQLEIIKFQQKHNHLFNDVIVIINT